MHRQYSRICFAFLVSLILGAIPLHAFAEPQAPAASTGNTIQLNALLSPELNNGGTFSVNAYPYDKIDGGDLTTYSVTNISGLLEQSGKQNFIAVGMYADYTGLRAYAQSGLPMNCASGAASTNNGHGCQMAIPDVSMALSSDRLVKYIIDYDPGYGTWFFYVQPAEYPVAYQIGWLQTNPFQSSMTKPTVQWSVNYQGLLYTPGANQINALFVGAQGYSYLYSIYTTFASAVTQYTYTNVADALACTSGILGIVPLWFDPAAWAAGHLTGTRGTVINWVCGGYQIWPTGPSATSKVAAKGAKVAKLAYPRYTGPADTLTDINLYPSENPLDQRRVRLGSGPNGAFAAKGDVVLHLLSDAARSESALSAWLRANPQWRDAEELWLAPDRHLSELDPTSPDALHFQETH